MSDERAHDTPQKILKNSANRQLPIDISGVSQFEIKNSKKDEPNPYCEAPFTHCLLADWLFAHQRSSNYHDNSDNLTPYWKNQRGK